MYLSPRHSEIIQMAKDNGRVLVDDLASHFNVTPQTIRKDLNDLCDQRLLSRIHGGALFPSGIENVEYEARRKIAADRKAGDRPRGRARSFPTTPRCSSTSAPPPRRSAKRCSTMRG